VPSRSLERRLSQPPGQHGQRRARKPSEYSRQLREKQKLKRMFGLRERQFRRYFEMSERHAGPTGDNLLQLLESRLDNVVYRLGFGRTRQMARQLVGHGHVRVNGQKVDIASYLVRPGEIITLTEAAAKIPQVEENLASSAPPPPWLLRDGASGRVISLSSPQDAEQDVDTGQIIAFYSR
jgi:small subunit ribosomal protein S4